MLALLCCVICVIGRVVVVHSFIPAEARECWRGLTMEELVLGRNMRGVWCSDPAKLLLLLFFHLVQHLEESFSALEWWDHPREIQLSVCVVGWGALLLHCAS